MDSFNRSMKLSRSVTVLISLRSSLRSTVSEVNQQVRGTFTEAGDVMRGKPLGDGRREDAAPASETPVVATHVDAPHAEAAHVSAPAAPMDPEGPDVSK